MEKRFLFWILIITLFTTVYIYLQVRKDIPNSVQENQFPDQRNSVNNTNGTNAQSINSETSKRMEQLFTRRREIIKNGCQKLNATSIPSEKSKQNQLVIDKKHLIYYCPIPKVSSTFWKRILTVMASKGTLTSPFQIGLGQVRLNNLNDLSKEEINILFSKGSSFMFVRDPYARLFSGYENKIYHPNLMYWRAVGRDVVHIIRNNTDDVYERFGFDVTFSEFVKYILYLSDSGKGIDRHFAPMHKRCNPCSTYFQYIGKLETMAADEDFLLNKWKTEFDDVSFQFEDFHTETVLDTAKSHVSFLFQVKNILDEIKFPFSKFMIRTWRDLQMRGYISKYIDFPYRESEADNVTKEEYFEAIKRVLKIPVNRTEVKEQRKEALIQAYRQIPMEDMERLRLYVLKDCVLFGYDDRPKELFDRTLDSEDDFTYLEGLF